MISRSNLTPTDFFTIQLRSHTFNVDVCPVRRHKHQFDIARAVMIHAVAAHRGVPNRSTILTDIVFNVPRVFVRRVLDCNGLVGGLLAIRISGRIFRFAVASGKRYGRHYDGQQQGYCSFHCCSSHSLILVCSFRSAAIPPAADHTLQSAVFGRDALTSSQYSVDNA